MLKSFRALLALSLICSISGCSHKTEDALAAVTKERNEGQQAFAKAQEQLAQLEAENQQLKQTAHFYFDQGTDELSKATSANTNDADRTAITKFQEVVNRFPDDPLAAIATDKIKSVEKRISERHLELEKAQAEVVRLVKTCHESTVAVQRINGRNDVLVANRWDQLAISASALLAHEREAKPYEEAAQKAKERAGALLENVPDPDKTLAQKVDGCDNTDE
jgi:prophage DNA circulation protein